MDKFKRKSSQWTIIHIYYVETKFRERNFSAFYSGGHLQFKYKWKQIRCTKGISVYVMLKIYDTTIREK